MSLPTGAKRLEWIETDGNAYVDTRFKPTSNTRIRMTVSDWPPDEISTALFGTQSSSNDRYEFLVPNATGRYRSFYAGAQANFVTSADLGKVLVERNGNVTSIGGNVLTNTAATFSLSTTLFLFAHNSNGTATRKAALKCYYGQIFEVGLLERDYIPCQLADGSIGLWDDVYGEFYGNAGTGSFTAGPEVTEEWEGTQLEYVQSDGSQYVNTRFSPNGNSKASVRVLCGYGDMWAVGSDDGWLNHGFGFGATHGEYGTQEFWGNYGDNAWHNVTLDKGVYSIDGTITATASAAAFQTTNTLYLFALNQNGTSAGLLIGSISEAQIYDNNTAARSYIPWLHPSGVAGLLDTVNDRFYASASTTDLIAGPVAILIPAPPADLTATLLTTTQVQLTWSASASANGYRVYRDGNLLSDQTGTIFTETVTKGQTYTYSVSAYNDEGESEASSVSIFVPLAPPATPTGLAASIDLDYVTLSWNVQAEADGYRLSRDGVQLTDTTGDSYTEEVTTGRTYTYSLTAYNEDGVSRAAMLTVDVPYVPEEPPDAVTGLTATAGLSSVELSWDAMADAEGYRVYRDGVLINTVAATEYKDIGLLAGTEYAYAVAAYNVRGDAPAAGVTALPDLRLITDRTEDDVAIRNSKGVYQVSDLNRVGEAMSYIANLLTEAGYLVQVSPRTDWTESDVMRPADATAYLGDLSEIRRQLTAFASTPTAPVTMERMLHTTANDIEKILLDVFAQYNTMLTTRVPSGAATSGGDYL